MVAKETIVDRTTPQSENFAFRDVRFGSEADICAATSHARFTPNSDRESDFPQTVMSALPPKADMCGATRHVGTAAHAGPDRLVRDEFQPVD